MEEAAGWAEGAAGWMEEATAKVEAAAGWMEKAAAKVEEAAGALQGSLHHYQGLSSLTQEVVNTKQLSYEKINK